MDPHIVLIPRPYVKGMVLPPYVWAFIEEFSDLYITLTLITY